ncbi:hypothetical protein E4H12_15530 [Candidatus Thorarchaeota archaeon]|nr:MAG: hypothetical protein E4H12_15530 [Candidatus Thorarchaeota archaeon]
MEEICALIWLESYRIEDQSSLSVIAQEELMHKIEDGRYARPETRCEIMQVADAFRAKMRSSSGTLIGASANAVTVGLAERAGNCCSFEFLKVGAPVMLVSVLVGIIYVLIVSTMGHVYRTLLP